MKPSLYRVILPVGDVEAAASFYSQLFQQPGERISPGRYYFDCDGVVLACFDPQADGDDFDARPNPDHIYIAVDGLEDVFVRIRSLGCEWLEEAIETRPWGERSFYAKDPFGNPISFVDRSTKFTGEVKTD